MPKYTAVAPTFTPLDYKTRIAPLEQYKEEYDKRMDALDEQGVLADAIGGLIDENQDPELARTYRDYNDKMVSTAQSLLQTGDLGSSRRSLGELRRDYANKLVPIQQAFNARAEAGKAYRDAKRKDPSYIGIDPLSHGLSDYMHGNMPDDKYVSGNQLYDFAMKDTAAASARNVLYGKWGLDKDLLKQYFGRQIITGFSEDEVGEALKYYMADSGQDPSKITVEDAKQVAGALRAIQGAVNRTMSKAEGLNDDLYNQALGYALQGAITGIGYKKDDDYKGYDPAFWLKYQNEWNKAHSGGGGPSQLVSSFGTTDVVNIKGNMRPLVEVAQLLSDIGQRKVSIDDKTGNRIQETDYKVLPYDNAYKPYRDETYGDRLWQLASSIGEVPKGKTKEEFLDSIRNGSEESFASAIQSIQDRVSANAKTYGEAYGKLTDNKYWVQNVNYANATFYADKGKNKGGTGLIRDLHGNLVQEIPSGGNYILPVRNNERKGIKYTSGSGRDTREYYISPDAFSGAQVYYRGAIIPLRTALSEYYRSLDNMDAQKATDLRAGIMDTLASYGTDMLQIEGATNSAMNTVEK